MTAPSPESASTPFQGSDRLFNNADSFAHAFDQAWHSQSESQTEPRPDGAEKLELILGHVADHPFAQADPAMARQVGEFRIRLLGL